MIHRPIIDSIKAQQKKHWQYNGDAQQRITGSPAKNHFKHNRNAQYQINLSPAKNHWQYISYRARFIAAPALIQSFQQSIMAQTIHYT